jgi:hypothetical protein
MPAAPEAWGAMPIDELMVLLETTTKQLATQIQELAVDQGAYHRKFWATWTQLPEDFSVAAANRECERHCAELQEQVTLGTSLVEGLRAKRDALVAILAARAK